ncbi:MAG: PUA domain-containing protein [Candidatus Bathyarchaeia archaeon]
MCIKRRYSLKSSEKKALSRRIFDEFGIYIEDIVGDEMNIEVAELHEKKTLMIINGRSLFTESEGVLIPTLLFEELVGRLPKAFVDMGAVPHICNGADVMAPGIVRIEGEFKEGDFVAVLDEKHGKAIAITRALTSSEVIKGLKRGKVLKNIHYIGDSIWKIISKKVKI